MERNKLIEDNLGLVYAAANKYKWHRDYEDIVQAGAEGLCMAADRFDQSRGAKFGYYATLCITHRIILYLRTHSYGPIRPTQHADKSISCAEYTSLDTPYSAGDRTLQDTLPDFRDCIEDAENSVFMAQALDWLKDRVSARCLEMFKMRLAGAIFKDIGKQFGCSQQSACQNIKKAERLLQDRYREAG